MRTGVIVFRLGALLALLLPQAGVASTEPAAMLFTNATVGITSKSRVPVINSSGRPIVIKNIELSCSCLRVEQAPQNVAPGSAADIRLAYDPVKPGPTELTMLVETDDGANSVLEFHWSGEVVAAPVPAIESAASLAAKPEEILAAAADGRLIDVRMPQDFAMSHVSGAVNRPLSDLGSAPAAGDQPLVLYGTGADDDAILRFAAGQTEGGERQSFKVMTGGLRRAADAGLTLAGPATGSALPYMVQPGVYQAEPDRWILVRLSAGGPDIPFSGATEEVDLRDGASVVRKLEDVAGREDGKKVLVASSLGEGYDSLEKLIGSKPGVGPFYLQGGLKAYNDHSANMEARSKSRVVRLVSKSDSQAGGVAGRKPCGTCP
jgi:rhodanese-related sulfurtransferase